MTGSVTHVTPWPLIGVTRAHTSNMEAGVTSVTAARASSTEVRDALGHPKKWHNSVATLHEVGCRHTRVTAGVCPSPRRLLDPVTENRAWRDRRPYLMGRTNSKSTITALSASTRPSPTRAGSSQSPSRPSR
jgi:hypothetical protein